MEAPCREELTRFKKTHKTLTAEHAEHAERQNVPESHRSAEDGAETSALPGG
jgi:hypothetical protein